MNIQCRIPKIWTWPNFLSSSYINYQPQHIKKIYKKNTTKKKFKILQNYFNLIVRWIMMEQETKLPNTLKILITFMKNPKQNRRIPDIIWESFAFTNQEKCNLWQESSFLMLKEPFNLNVILRLLESMCWELKRKNLPSKEFRNFQKNLFSVLILKIFITYECLF